MNVDWGRSSFDLRKHETNLSIQRHRVQLHLAPHHYVLVWWCLNEGYLVGFNEKYRKTVYDYNKAEMSKCISKQPKALSTSTKMVHLPPSLASIAGENVAHLFQKRLPCRKNDHKQRQNKFNNRELTQQDGWKTQDCRLTKKCGARLCIPNLTRHLFVILPSWVFQPSCCVSFLILSQDHNARTCNSTLQERNLTQQMQTVNFVWRV